MKSQTMKAIRIHSYGGPEVLKYEDAPRPRPQRDELLIRVHAASVNPLDWKVRSGSMREFLQHKLPLIPGWDVSGVVEESGPDASRFHKGNEVFAMAHPMQNGAYAEFIVLPEKLTARKPRSLHFVHAAAVPLAALTAWRALFEMAQLKPGQRILIHGASGGVGHFAVQLAKWKGAYVFATASTKNQKLLRELGVDEPIDYTTQRFEAVAHNIDVVLDTVGADTLNRSWQVVRKGGDLLSLVQLPSDEEARAHGVRSAMVVNTPRGDWLGDIARLIDDGKLKVILDRILPLSEARRSHELSESGHARGKIVLRVAEVRS